MRRVMSTVLYVCEFITPSRIAQRTAHRWLYKCNSPRSRNQRGCLRQIGSDELMQAPERRRGGKESVERKLPSETRHPHNFPMSNKKRPTTAIDQPEEVVAACLVAGRSAGQTRHHRNCLFQMAVSTPLAQHRRHRVSPHCFLLTA